MGYLYEAIHSAKEEMLRRFQRKMTKVQPFLNIINNRWDEQLYRKLVTMSRSHKLITLASNTTHKIV
jgi:predicted component of type VI protein secretion system